MILGFQNTKIIMLIAVLCRGICHSGGSIEQGVHKNATKRIYPR